VLAFATSALRDAGSHRDVVERVRDDTGVVLRMLPGEDEARYTFLAARRWFGWSAGRLLVVDIGGGSLELAAGRDEDPDVAESLPLGAGRLTRDSFTSDPPSSREIAALAERIEPAVVAVADRVCAAGAADCVVGTSKALRSTRAAHRCCAVRRRAAGAPRPHRRGVAPASRVHQPDGLA